MPKNTKTQNMQKTLHKLGVFYNIEKRKTPETEVLAFCAITFELIEVQTRSAP